MVSGVNTAVDRALSGADDHASAGKRKAGAAAEIAGSGERIRNLAQNELGMLRRERAQTETIYIQAPDKKGAGRGTRQSVRRTWKFPRFPAGSANVFHIGE